MRDPVASAPGFLGFAAGKDFREYPTAKSLEARADKDLVRCHEPDAALARLAEAQSRTEAEVRSLTMAVQRLTIRTDAVIGRTLELQFRDWLTSYLGRFVRRGRLMANDELIDTIESRVTDQEIDDLLRADAIASGLVDGQKTHVVVEVSSTG